MTRGIRGATTVNKNTQEEILENTKNLIEEMIENNGVQPDDISHVFISATEDVNAVFPAKALRSLEGWTYVPVMCMREMDVQQGLAFCIRVMMVVNTSKGQKEIQHVFHKDAVKLRPDLAGR
ncbi:chorismate mutase [Virgibacillus xinjiangensis]|uniref:chorismate mutase n=1 Tax=Virgibacillus xinjiangensis TaxID=393090 RepID=A0ABV7CRM8_9BACI